MVPLMVPLMAIVALLVVPLRGAAQDTVRTDSSAVPPPTTVCTDGFATRSTAHDVCAAHGGVDAKATAAAQKGAATKTPGTVACTDGTASAAGRGACAGHGGVRTPAAKRPVAPPPPPAPLPPPAPAPAPPPRALVDR
jgi:hypothetical protein